MRKHLYLITEHPDEEKIGLADIRDSPAMSTANKNEEGIAYKLNRATGDRYEIKHVGLGYADFESQAEYDETIGEVIESKLKEIDSKYIEKAGVNAFLEARR